VVEGSKDKSIDVANLLASKAYVKQAEPCKELTQKLIIDPEKP